MKKLAIDIQHLTVGYNRETVIEDITFQIFEGDFFGIIGPNGGGKSTLLKAILGLIPVKTGSIRIFGKSPQDARRFLGYVPQFAEFDKRFPISVWDVVLMGRRSVRGMHPFYSPEDKKQALKALQTVQMDGFRKRHISELSGGQRQRVYIARALVSNPRVLLLDEPTASVDKEMQKTIYDFLTELNKKMTIVLITHDIGVLSAYVNRVSCLNRFLFTHDNDDSVISKDMLEAAYNCPVDLIAHGVPHRVLEDHKKLSEKKQHREGKI